MLQMFGLRGGTTSSSSSSPKSDPPNPDPIPSPIPNAGDSPSPGPASASGDVGPARPVRLVYCDEKGKFRMDPEAIAALQLVRGPIGIVSVCGRARQGKSFILNQVRVHKFSF